MLLSTNMKNHAFRVLVWVQAASVHLKQATRGPMKKLDVNNHPMKPKHHRLSSGLKSLVLGGLRQRVPKNKY